MFCYDKKQQYEAGLKKPDNRFPFYFNRQWIELRSWSQASSLDTTGEFRFVNGESLKSEPILWKNFSEEFAGAERA